MLKKYLTIQNESGKLIPEAERYSNSKNEKPKGANNMEKNIDNYIAVAGKLAEVMEELKALGAHGMVVMEDDGTYEVLVNNENLPEGKPIYRKLSINSYTDIEKGVKVGKVYFHTYITREQAKEELLA